MGIFANPRMNFDRFHQPRPACGHLLVWVYTVEIAPAQTERSISRRSSSWGYKATHASYQQPDQQMQTRRYHSRTLIRPSLGMGAFSPLPCTITTVLHAPGPLRAHCRLLTAGIWGAHFPSPSLRPSQARRKIGCWPMCAKYHLFVAKCNCLGQ